MSDFEITVPLKRMSHAEGLQLPDSATPHSAGVDLRAAVPEDEPITLDPGERTLLPTGLKIALPVGFEGQVRPRSGLAVKRGITVINAPGTIDSDYRGEVKVGLVNLGQDAFTITRGERIAQLVVARHAVVDWQEEDSLSATARGTGGFGSTGRS